MTRKNSLKLNIESFDVQVEVSVVCQRTPAFQKAILINSSEAVLYHRKFLRSEERGTSGTDYQRDIEIQGRLQLPTGS